MQAYPSEREHKWAFGDLSPEIIEKSISNPSMRDVLTEASPFEITPEGKIIYSREFKNPEFYRPQYAHKENPDKMKDLT